MKEIMGGIPKERPPDCFCECLEADYLRADMAGWLNDTCGCGCPGWLYEMAEQTAIETLP